MASLLWLLATVATAADRGGEVEVLLRAIRQEQPVPRLACLQQVRPINVGSTYYQGVCNGIEVAVETHPNSKLVASVLLKISGADLVREILPAVSRVLGKPHQSDNETPSYGWSWPKYRTASLHYAGVGKAAADRVAIVSLYYQ